MMMRLEMVLASIILCLLAGACSTPKPAPQLRDLNVSKHLTYSDLVERRIVMLEPWQPPNVEWSEADVMEFQKLIQTEVTDFSGIDVLTHSETEDVSDCYVLRTRIISDQDWQRSEKVTREVGHGENRKEKVFTDTTWTRRIEVEYILHEPAIRRDMPGPIVLIRRVEGYGESSISREAGDITDVWGVARAVITEPFRKQLNRPTLFSTLIHSGDFLARSLPTRPGGNYGHCRARMYFGGQKPHQWYFANDCQQALSSCEVAATAIGKGHWRCEIHPYDDPWITFF